MRATWRFLLCLFLSGSIGFASVPMQVPVPQIEKVSCCAKMETGSATHDCDRPAPKPDQDKQCCAFCAVGLALLPAMATPFVYPPVGDERFPAYISSGHSHSERPPVPPPRV